MNAAISREAAAALAIQPRQDSIPADLLMKRAAGLPLRYACEAAQALAVAEHQQESPGSPMVLDPRRVLLHVVRPVLARLKLPRPETAERLLMGTAAHESMGFTKLWQIGGPALGLFQMEPRTVLDLADRYGKRFNLFEWLPPGMGPTAGLTISHHFAALMCRVHYYARPFEMPPVEEATVQVLGDLWKRHYNTIRGKGRVPDFIAAYERHVEPLYN